DELVLRVGRFSPSFGAFNLRHDPANHVASDKPLPYDMGRMLRKQDWNNGVLPSPFPANGAEINGSAAVGETGQVDYAVYAVTTFENYVDPNPTDLAFQESHQPPYVNVGVRPAFGTRLGATIGKGSATALTLGSSAMLGTYDKNDNFTYVIAG